MGRQISRKAPPTYFPTIFAAVAKAKLIGPGQLGADTFRRKLKAYFLACYLITLCQAKGIYNKLGTSNGAVVSTAAIAIFQGRKRRKAGNFFPALTFKTFLEAGSGGKSQIFFKAPKNFLSEVTSPGPSDQSPNPQPSFPAWN